MAFYSSTKYSGDGSTDVFALNFKYLFRAHITVTVDGTEVNFDFQTRFTVKLASIPAVGAVVEIRRITPVAEPIVDFQNGAILSTRNLDLQARQFLFIMQETYDRLVIMQETYDRLASQIKLTAQGWDAFNRKIINTAPATKDGDVVVYEQTVGLADRAEAARDLAIAARDAAQASETACAAASGKVGVNDAGRYGYLRDVLVSETEGGIKFTVSGDDLLAGLDDTEHAGVNLNLASSFI